MFIDQKNCRKARVIKEKILDDGSIKRETLIDGICIKETSSGAFVYDPKEQEGVPTWAEWFPFKADSGIRAILYC